MNDNQIDTSAVTDPNLPIQTTQVTANDDDTAEHDDSSDGSDCQVIDETKRPDERPLTPDAKQMGGSLGICVGMSYYCSSITDAAWNLDMLPPFIRC